MAKKKIEPIESLGNTDKLTVQKSKPLFALWQSELTLAEFKILDTYLGRINSHDDEHRTVKFEKGELEELLGVKQLKPQVLDDRLKHLMTTVRIPDDGSKRGFTRISLFEKAHAEQDDYGVWEAELTCTESAKKYIFDVENITYLRYKLKNIINIKSRYTYIMFLYLWKNKYRGTWEIGLDELKSMLNCENEEYCSQFKVFNDRVLKRVHKEIHEVTDIRYDYETVKRGRSVVAVRFIYKSKFDELPTDPLMKDQLTFDDIETDEREENEIDYGGELANLLGDSACDNEFSVEQIRVIQDLVIKIIPENDNLKRCDYIIEKMHLIDYYSTRNPIPNRFEYLKKILQNEIIK